ncbi:MAG TPA: UDP-N-acetylmuramate dehydrogenase [Phycisphaerae bacterium]|nr:UDP-N-acetylmuramate dehydrogenase [Phycisphaerae bacterium]
MSWLNGLQGRIEHDAPLGALTWYGLGGRARHLLHPTGPRELGQVLQHARDDGLATKVLGAGANVLITDDGFDGVVIRLDDPSFKRISIDGRTVRVGCGAELMTLVRQCSQRGLAGLEGLAGIPGTVGGAIRMNAGGRHGEIGDVVESVEVLTPGLDQRVLTREQVGFAYRHTELGDSIVTAATLRLQESEPRKVYARFQEIWRAKKAAQPMTERSAGCIFANPPGDSAGRLIDRAGLKGTRCGGARVSERHANFIVADPGATAADVLQLIDRVRQTVRQQFGTELELEIDIW